jgi:hypothetical protein
MFERELERLKKCYLCPRTPVTYVSGLYIRERAGVRVKAPVSLPLTLSLSPQGRGNFSPFPLEGE